MTPLAKIGTGVITIGTVGGVGYGFVAYSQEQGITISKLIEKKYEYILLSTIRDDSNTDKSHWTNNWNNYKTESEKLTNDIFGLDGWTKTATPDLTEKLKEKCEELAKKTVYDEGKELYGNVTKYCARGVTFEEQAQKDGIAILDTKTPSDSSSNIWTTKHNNRAQISGELEKLSIAKETASGEAIRQGCETAKAKNKQVPNYTEVYAAFKKVCAE